MRRQRVDLPRRARVYRKFHPFWLTCFATPDLVYDNIEIASRSDPSHSVKLGCFTCYDIVFSEPKDGLVKRGVKLFSYSSAIPLIGVAAVKLFSWLSNSTVVSSNNILGESGIFASGTVLSSCGSASSSPSPAAVVLGGGEARYSYCLAHSNVDV